MSIIRKVAAGAAAAVTAVILTAVTGGAPAGATVACVNALHTNTDGITVVGTATATVVAGGVKVTTGVTSDADKVTWKYTAPAAVDADDVTGASYITTKQDDPGPGVNDAALPAYHLYVHTTAGDATLVYEPYYQISGNPARNTATTWNVLAGKFWTSSTNVAGLPAEGGGSYAGNKTWTDIKAANPGMTVTGYGFGLGTYNRGVIATLNNLLFSSKVNTTSKCTKHQWIQPIVQPSRSKSPSASASLTTSAAPTTPGASMTPAAVTGTLPVTGPGATVGIGLALVVAGAVAVIVARRRRTVTFVNE